MLDVRGNQIQSRTQSQGDFSGPPVVGQNDEGASSEASQINANLIDSENAKDRKGSGKIIQFDADNNTKKVLLFWAILVVIVAGVGLFANFQVSRTAAQETGFNSQIAEAQNRLSGGELGESLAQLQGIVRQEVIYKDFVNNSLLWPQMLLELTARVPVGVKVTELSFGRDNLLLIKGEAGQYVDVANLSVALKSSPIFNNVNISSSTLFTGSTGNAVSFDIRARYIPVNSDNINNLFQANNTIESQNSTETGEEFIE